MMTLHYVKGLTRYLKKASLIHIDGHSSFCSHSNNCIQYIVSLPVSWKCHMKTCSIYLNDLKFKLIHIDRIILSYEQRDAGKTNPTLQRHSPELNAGCRDKGTDPFFPPPMFCNWISSCIRICIGICINIYI